MHKWLLPLLGSLWLAGCSDNNWRTTDVSEFMPDLDFELVDENGRDVSAEDYLGKNTILYFGYTHCPDVCPITLAGLATAIRKVDAEVRDDIQVLFVSVDPGRDTPDVMKRYTNYFGPQFIGLTGSTAQIDELTNRYRITYEYGDKDEEGNYDVSHSSAAFAFNKQGEAEFMIRDSDPTANVVADLSRLAKRG
ncbi:SCO family protein [Modicisalibacter tunisiensis]|uniref:SCO family protein n=3 Tax=Halomonadaceae TaxID=28256 RepID=A0ABS7X2P5_9GAMM|nr:SCO family protein [Modicisalibacter sp. 'Wilcox']MBZ9537404.1 SCO family protein [Modicisalibacter tunisiensis]MBZ9569173.1 SCO family protein [Modicisalibacter tunisiensis]